MPKILRWAPRGALALVVVVVAAAAAGVTYEAIAAAQDAAAYPPPGRLVNVGGHRLHLSCVGEGSPTVVFESGLANMSADWSKVQPQVGATTRACAYDRAGIGWSDNGEQPRDSRQIAQELHTLLANAGISGPFVLVGQSFGGLYVRMFADLYPDEAAGMVLVDASHPDMWSRTPPALTAALVPSPALGLAYRGMAHIGISRLTANFPADCGLTPQHCGEERAWKVSARATDAYIAEMGAPERDAQVRATRTLGARPLVVLTATDHTTEFGPYAAQVDPLWQQMQNELAALSSNSAHCIVDGATHSSLQAKDAAATSAAIGQVVRAVRDGQPLVHEDPAPTRQTASAEVDFAAIDRFVDSERQAMRVPGITIGIVRGDRVVHLAGFGQADPTGRPVTPQTPMLTASITKSFTAMSVMQLVEAGKVDLDAPIQRYLPWFRVADADASAGITVRHLLNQTSGFPTLPANAGLVGGDMDELALERAVRSLASVSLSQPVGLTYQYSNFNYWTLGVLVQEVSGQSYEQYLQQHVLEPLDMRRSYMSQAAAQRNGLATGYRFWFGIPVATDLTYSRAFTSTGGLISTSEDMAHYLVAQLNGGRYAGRSVLSPAGIAEQHRPAARVEDTDDYYGMGWQTGAIGGVPVVQHDGLLPTGYADMVLVPDHDLGMVVLANGVGRVAVPRLGGVAAGVANVVVGRPALPAAEDRLFQAVTVLAFVIIGVQVFGMIWTTTRLRRWRKRPESRPSRALPLAWHIGVPLVVNLGWAALVLLELPMLFGLTLAESVFNLGDFAYLIAGSAAVALVWGPLRTLLGWHALRATAPASASSTPTLAAVVATSKA